MGQQSTQTGAMQADRTQTNFNAFAPLIANAQAQASQEIDHADR